MLHPLRELTVVAIDMVLIKITIVSMIILFGGCKKAEERNQTPPQNREDDKLSVVRELTGLDSSSVNKLKGVEYSGELPFSIPLEDNGGWLITDDRNYSVSYYALDSLQLLLLETNIATDPATGRRINRIVDVLVVVINNPEYFISSTYCRCNNVLDSRLFALVKSTRTEYYEDVLRAWRVNTGEKRFEEISPGCVKCVNESFGD